MEREIAVAALDQGERVAVWKMHLNFLEWRDSLLYMEVSEGQLTFERCCLLENRWLIPLGLTVPMLKPCGLYQAATMGRGEASYEISHVLVSRDAW